MDLDFFAANDYFLSVLSIIIFSKKEMKLWFAGSFDGKCNDDDFGLSFLWYIDYINAYQRIYGSFGVLLVLYLSMYILASIFYLGYCLNTVFENKSNTVVYKHDCFYRKINEKIGHFHL